jgi:type IV pilus assembly protein PilY1
MGNAIYMVDATTGELLWNSSNLGSDLNLIEMTNSIVANIVAVDSTLDGYANLLYTADVGGRVWRLDLDNSATTAAAFAQGGVIADFNGGFINNNIRFFNTPDVAYTRYGGFSPDGQFQISIGSGYRAHPLDTQVTDRFYIINDTHVSTVPTNYTDYSEADLANINNFSSASESQQQAGSYYVFSSTGEKVLSSSVTVADNILFTTYRPVLDPIALTSCDANTGDTRLYQVKPIAPQSSDDSPLERDWGFTELAQGGIPPNPVVLFPPSDSPTEGDGDECPAGEVCPPPCEGEECESSCEQLTSITAIGAETVNSNITRCDQLTKKYWLIN